MRRAKNLRVVPNPISNFEERAEILASTHDMQQACCVARDLHRTRRWRSEGKGREPFDVLCKRFREVGLDHSRFTNHHGKWWQARGLHGRFRLCRRARSARLPKGHALRRR